MPRPKSASVRVAPHEVEDTIIREEPVLLTLEDRTALRAMFASAPFKKALHNARLSRPSEFGTGMGVALNSALGAVVGNNRLHEIRGWKMFEVALSKQIEDPKVPPAPVPDDYKRER
jgi:hypothetical protein